MTPRAPRTGPVTLASRLVAIGFVQLLLLVGFAVLIGLLTLPSGPHDAGPPSPPHEPMREPRHGGPPPRRATPHGDSPLERPWVGWSLTLLAGVVIIGSGSLLTARWIAMPIAQLAKAVRAVGEGDLQVRAEVTRDDEIGDLARAFDEMVSRVARLLAAERELLANVSHELRTPLARIRVACDLAAEGDHESARMALAEITTDLAELELVVDNVLTAARLDAATRVGRVTLSSGSHEPVSLSDVVGRAKARFEALHPTYRVILSDQDGDGVVRADPVLLRRVFDNLLDNARKYGGDAPGPIAIQVASSADNVVCGIRDEGPGIPPGDLARIFDPFFRAERSRSREGGGVGLGLTLVRRIVESHGGSVRVESEPGAGTRVVVTLPRV